MLGTLIILVLYQVSTLSQKQQQKINTNKIKLSMAIHCTIVKGMYLSWKFHFYIFLNHIIICLLWFFCEFPHVLFVIGICGQYDMSTRRVAYQSISYLASYLPTLVSSNMFYFTIYVGQLYPCIIDCDSDGGGVWQLTTFLRIL